MNEMDIMRLFYDEMKLRGTTRDLVFLNMDEAAVEVLSKKLSVPVQLDDIHRFTDICIANEWIERTTIDPGYNFLSLTEAGLQTVLNYQYS